MPPLSLMVEVLLYAVLPAAVTAAFVMWVVERLGGAKLAPLAAALAFAAGVVGGQWLRQAAAISPADWTWELLGNTLSLMAGESSWNRMAIAALIALLVGLMARLPRLPSDLGWLLRAGAAIWIAWWVIPAEPRIEPAWVRPALATLILAQWVLLEPLGARPPGGSVPMSLALSAFVAAIVLIHAGSERLTGLATVISAALGGIALIAEWRRIDSSGVVPGAAVLLPGLLLMGKQEIESEVPWQAFALPALAPLALALTAGLEKWPHWVVFLLRSALVLIPLAVAAKLALDTGPLVFE